MDISHRARAADPGGQAADGTPRHCYNTARHFHGVQASLQLAPDLFHAASVFISALRGKTVAYVLDLKKTPQDSLPEAVQELDPAPLQRQQPHFRNAKGPSNRRSLRGNTAKIAFQRDVQLCLEGLGPVRQLCRSVWQQRSQCIQVLHECCVVRFLASTRALSRQCRRDVPTSTLQGPQQKLPCLARGTGCKHHVHRQQDPDSDHSLEDCVHQRRQNARHRVGS
mmetsp:Transcript_76135/g.223208  ORF Transcript_76135/g.223208 Transcript_76135/m.223208 type:complete len:224 (-) Transcript_76135:727-1398(-)